MVSKVAQIREEMSIAHDLTKGQILFVAIPVLNDKDYAALKFIQATRALNINEEISNGE